MLKIKCILNKSLTSTHSIANELNIIIEKGCSTIEGYELPNFSTKSNNEGREELFLETGIDVHVSFAGKIVSLLGLDEEWLPFGKKISINLDKSLLDSKDDIFVYSDIVQDQYVGDTLAPLIRTIHITQIQNNKIFVLFENPHYLPLKTRRLATINISILNHLGNHLRILNNFSTTVVKLHFRELRR
jgi:hypothetical protein